MTLPQNQIINKIIKQFWILLKELTLKEQQATTICEYDPAGSGWTFLTNQSLHLWPLSLDAQGKSKKSSSKHEPGNTIHKSTRYKTNKDLDRLVLQPIINYFLAVSLFICPFPPLPFLSPSLSFPLSSSYFPPGNFLSPPIPLLPPSYRYEQLSPFLLQTAYLVCI